MDEEAKRQLHEGLTQRIAAQLGSRDHNRDNLIGEQAILAAVDKVINDDNMAGIHTLLEELGIKTTRRAAITLIVEVPIGRTMDRHYVANQLAIATQRMNSPEESINSAPWVIAQDPGRDYPEGWTVGIVSPRIPQDGGSH